MNVNFFYKNDCTDRLIAAAQVSGYSRYRVFFSALIITLAFAHCKSWGKFWQKDGQADGIYQGSTVSFGAGASNLKKMPIVGDPNYAGEIWSGIIFGLLPSGAAGVEVAWDSSTTYLPATISGSQWKIFLPTGSAAASGFKRWQVGTKHSLNIRAFDASGNRSNATYLTFMRNMNKDINGDGYADIAVGAVFNSGANAAGGQTAGAANKGAIYVYYGSASSISRRDENPTPYYCGGPSASNGPDGCSVIANPDNVSGGFGNSVAFAGDVNGDGYADLVAGAPQNTGAAAAGGQTAGAANKGAAYIFYGSAMGVTKHDESPTPYYCSGPPDCTVVANPDNIASGSGNFGNSVAFAGDSNGDGFADIVVGAKANDGSSAAGGQTLGIANKGAAYVFYGSASGVTRRDEGPTPYYCGGAPNCTVIANPDNFAGGFGNSVAYAGDANGDGFGDIVIGAVSNNGTSAAGGQTAGASAKGAAYVFYGSGTGITKHDENATPYYCSGFPDCTVFANPDNSGGSFGISVGFASDVNADGFADTMVGAYGNNGTNAAGGQTTGAASKGAGYIIYGSAAGITKHDENATPFYCAGAPDCTVIGNPDNSGGNFGFSTNFAGDVNGDGYADVVIGAHQNNGASAAGGQTAGPIQKGAVYVYFGSAIGVTKHDENATPYYCSGYPDCTVIQNPDNNSGFFGFSAATAGDINGDGYADIFVGANTNYGASAAGGQSAGANAKGAAYIFYGSTTGVTKHDENPTPYYCSGPPDCTVIQNPDNQTTGNFGSIAFMGPFRYLAPFAGRPLTYRPSPDKPAVLYFGSKPPIG